MARQTKANLNSTTTVKAPEPTPEPTPAPALKPAAKSRPGTNVVPILDAATVKAYVIRAFKEDDEGDTLRRGATQRMAAAVMAQHEAWSQDLPEDIAALLQDGELPELSRCFHSAKARQSLLPALREVFLDKIGAGLSRDDKATAEAHKASHGTLIVNGTKMAAILATHGVSPRSFDDAGSFFRVPVKVIEPKGCKWLGVLSENAATTIIPLDGNSYSADILVNPDAVHGDKDFNKTRPARIKASANQMYAAAKSIVAKPTPGVQNKSLDAAATRELLKTIDPANLSMGWMFDTLYNMLMDPAGKDRFDSYNGLMFLAQWEHATDVRMWVEHATASKGFKADSLDAEMGKAKGKAS